MIEEHDDLTIYCSQLGGEVPFRYCRTVNDNVPCRKIVICWEFRLQISEFLDKHFSAEQVERALAPSTKSRLDTILELIEQAKEIKQEWE